jgi:hypothetical protein
MVNAMAQINNHIDDEIDRNFRDAVSKRLGFKQGNMRKALEEAIKMWINGPAPVAPAHEDGIIKTVTARHDGRCQLYLPKEYGGKTVRITIIDNV